MPARSRSIDKTASGSSRDVVMISHANPEDNEFTLWLALQLTREGYKVWSDVTDLLGGESFWKDIEQVIRTRAIKFIYVLSRTSNESDRGFRKELHLADSEAKKIMKAHPRFIIPVAIDDLPSSEYNIYLQHLNSIQSREWAAGLMDILKRLRRDKVPRFQREFNVKKVSSWWQTFRSSKAGVKRTPDKYLSNWFPIISFPQTIYLYVLDQVDEQFPAADFDLPFLFVQRGQYVLTFTKDASLKSGNQPITIASQEGVVLSELIKTSKKPGAKDDRGLKPLIAELLRLHWESWIESKTLGTYELANHRKCSFFKPVKGEDSLWVSYQGIDGEPARRSLVGIFTRRIASDPEHRSKHFWHFGIQARARLWPIQVLHISAHVLFSEDGVSIWDSKRRLHSARRRQCKSWYNDEWRDRLLAAMCYLADGKDFIEIEVGAETAIRISVSPVAFESQVTITPVEKLKTKIEASDVDEVDDEDDEDDEDEGDLKADGPDTEVPF
jgi:hypothetical protein